MKILSVGTLKGGTGKTTTAFNLAGCLSENNKVLLIDCDPQANLSQDCGIDITDTRLNSVKSIFDNGTEPMYTIIKNPIENLQNLDLIPSNIWLTETEMSLVNRSAREKILYNYIFLDNKDIFLKYDYIILDTNPSMGIINQNAFFVSDSILLITDISKNGLTGIELFDYLWSKACKDLRKENNVKALLLNNSDVRTNLSKELFEYCQNNDGINDILIEKVIPQSIKIKETSVMHKPINIYNSKSKECSIYFDIIKILKLKEIL